MRTPTARVNLAERTIRRARHDPRGQRIAYQIWCYAEPRGWDVTIPELAEVVGEPWMAVNMIVTNKGWNTRIRKVTLSHSIGAAEERSRSFFMDNALLDLERWA